MSKGLEANSNVCRSYMGKTCRVPFWLIQSWIGLIMDNPGPILNKVTTIVKLTGAYISLLKTTKSK